MSLNDKKVKTLYSQGGVTHYAVATDDRVVELIVEKDKAQKGEKAVRIRLKTTSRLHGPRMTTEELVSQVSK